jgi:hypothetical protein
LRRRETSRVGSGPASQSPILAGPDGQFHKLAGRDVHSVCLPRSRPEIRHVQYLKIIGGDTKACRGVASAAFLIVSHPTGGTISRDDVM